MKIHFLRDPIYTSNIYLLDARKPILIDTGGTLRDQILSWVPQILGKRRLSGIFFTHGHPDHIGDAEELSKLFEVPLYIHRAEIEKLPSAVVLPQPVDCGDFQLQVIHTPGHSPGGVCFFEKLSKSLICGDTVFPGGRVGRWDLPGSNYHDLVASVKRLCELDVQALYPGHYPLLLTDVRKHLQSSMDTISVIGDPFDDTKYDARIESLKSVLTL